MAKKIAQIISVIFHPVFIPTLGFLLFFNSNFYFSFITWEAKRFVLLVVLFSTGILPLLMMALLALNPKFKLSFETGSQRALPLIISSVSYYAGYFLLNRINAYPVFKLLLVASVLIIVLLLILSLKWKISGHMAAIGGLTGALLALSFRTGINPVWAIVTVIVVSGLVATSRLILEKNRLWHLEAGYALGFVTLYLVVYFV
ncbi:hypothetical protein SAMN05444274_105353 [Mariniphaga anaerophila]|uniref:PAP2 superfamily protein n=1 Tax=Mariniphaga anaerophila TaxID=1484053 RepID=A0A1M5BY47_9BACT|nr:hypothetical protein [Mariniphaga anaerophila]SHF47300.1 hypothetical protein SAMN05444274_105353 [Mariniphaga anaerophila]